MFDRPVEEPDEHEAIRAYTNTLGYDEQVVVCKEYLTHVKGWDLYDDWASAHSQFGKVDYPGITAYCEQLRSFWDFVCAEAC